jgi:hypothetical protein
MCYKMDDNENEKNNRKCQMLINSRFLQRIFQFYSFFLFLKDERCTSLVIVLQYLLT